MLEVETIHRRGSEASLDLEGRARLVGVTDATESTAAQAIRETFGEHGGPIPVAGKGVTALAVPSEEDREPGEVCTRLQPELRLVPLAAERTFRNPDGVRAALAGHRADLQRSLETLGRARQVELRALWDGDDLFDTLADEQAELKTLRQRVRQRSGASARTSLAQLGRRLESVLEEVRGEYAETLSEAVADLPRRTRRRRCRDERELLRAVFLVEPGDIDPLERRIYRAADQFDDRVQVEYTEPAAPAVFVDLQLSA